MASLARERLHQTLWFVIGVVAIATLGAQLVLAAPWAPAAAYKLAAECRSLSEAALPRLGLPTPTNRLCGPLELAGRSQINQIIARPLNAATADVEYPLGVSADGRYLVDQRGTPFLMVGDSPQALIGDLSIQEVEQFLDDRKKLGFNTLWLNLVCNDYTGCNSDGTTVDGVPPFTTPGDISTPNEAYFARADSVISLAEQRGLLVILDPIETGGWLPTLKANGAEKDYHYGQYLGARYKRFPNIIWMSGNDYQTWTDDADDTLVRAVADGIRDADPGHLQTVELNYPVSSSLDSSAWLPRVQLNSVYTYAPTYAEVLEQYARDDRMPVMMVEANYESEHDYIGPQTLRRQEYWSFLSGATGQLYGNRYTWQFIHEWQGHVDSLGSLQLRHLVDLFTSRPWFELVPDADHQVLVDGFGTFSESGSPNTSDYVAAARTRDGKLIMAYTPTPRSLTVDLSQAAGSMHARWYDPADGTFVEIAGSPFPNVGRVSFTPPPANADGDGDWVLVLETDG